MATKPPAKKTTPPKVTTPSVGKAPTVGKAAPAMATAGKVSPAPKQGTPAATTSNSMGYITLASTYELDRQAIEARKSLADANSESATRLGQSLVNRDRSLYSNSMGYAQSAASERQNLASRGMSRSSAALRRLSGIKGQYLSANEQANTDYSNDEKMYGTNGTYMTKATEHQNNILANITAEKNRITQENAATNKTQVEGAYANADAQLAEAKKLRDAKKGRQNVILARRAAERAAAKKKAAEAKKNQHPKPPKKGTSSNKHHNSRPR